MLISPSRLLSFPSVVSGVVAVVQDKAVAVRKNALALLSCVLDNNPFAGRYVRVGVGVWACGCRCACLFTELPASCVHPTYQRSDT